VAASGNVNPDATSSSATDTSGVGSRVGSDVGSGVVDSVQPTARAKSIAIDATERARTPFGG